MIARYRLAAILMMGAALAGCKHSGDVVMSDGVGITAVRTPCPAVGVPDYTGDITTFRTPGDKSAANVDVTATITDVRSTCDETAADKIYTNVTFNVYATRTNTQGARQVTLPYYSTVVRGGSSVVTKRVGQVTLNFANGQARTSASAQAGAFVDRAAATLPEDIRKQITKPRKAGDADAAVDPLSDPSVKAAVERATFELLVGFQLTQDQLAYNVTR
ncbi:hypothetical protein [Tsuneonella mangrovi]|uniref:hypothetical protein n=1 Tax=Tsuneonella mangrovi TaxID=1982042 RepID=UPI000BA1CC1D|nr:hypothetical protein [Tsuneonella mangrovi]